MSKPTLSLAAALLLGVTPIAYAQDGPRDQMPSPSLERGPRADMPGGGGDGPRRRASDGAGSRDEGPGSAGSETGDDAPMRRSEGPNPAVRDGAPRGEPSGAERKDAPSAKEKRADDSGKSTRKSSDDTKGDRKARAEKTDKSPDKAASEAKSRTDAQAKSEKDRSDRSKDAAAADKAKPADADKQADAKAEGGRKSVDEVKKADLSGDRRTRVETAFRGSRDVKRRTDVDINISVGSRLPRDWDFVPVPVAVIEVVPEYRGYVFAYVEDEYVICDPVTYEVVAVLPAGDSGPAYAAGGGGGVVADRCSANLTLSDDERADILRSIQMTDEVDVKNITVGWSVPGEIELRRFPEPVLSQNGKLESCRYFIADDQIAIVDPSEEMVVLLIDHND